MFEVLKDRNILHTYDSFKIVYFKVAVENSTMLISSWLSVLYFAMCRCTSIMYNNTHLNKIKIIFKSIPYFIYYSAQPNAW